MSKRFFITLSALILICLLAGGAITAKYLGERFAMRKLDSIISRISDRAAITYEDVDIDFILLDLTLDNLTITLPEGPKATIDRITVKDIDYHHPRRPLYLTLEIKGIHMDVTQENLHQAFEDFAGLGYSNLTFDIRLNYDMDAFFNTVRLTELKVHAPGMGDLRTTFLLSNFHMDKVLSGQFEGVIIENFFLHYNDDSLLKNLFAIAAETEPEFVDFFIEGLEEDLAKARQDYNERSARSIQELIAFLRQPERLAITVDQQRPIVVRNILLFKKISELLQLFQITFESGPEM